MSNETQDKQVATEILNQLGGMNRLNIMTGAYNFVAHPNGVSFKIKNPRANYIKVTLYNDLYNLEVGRIRGHNYKVLVDDKGLYFDMLRPAIEKATGMYLSLGTMGKTGKMKNGGTIDGNYNKWANENLYNYLMPNETSKSDLFYSVMKITESALRDANYHDEVKKINEVFKGAEFNETPYKSSLTGNMITPDKNKYDELFKHKGKELAQKAKWNGDKIIDGISYFLSMNGYRTTSEKLDTLKNNVAIEKKSLGGVLLGAAAVGAAVVYFSPKDNETKENPYSHFKINEEAEAAYLKRKANPRKRIKYALKDLPSKIRFYDPNNGEEGTIGRVHAKYDDKNNKWIEISRDEYDDIYSSAIDYKKNDDDDFGYWRKYNSEPMKGDVFEHKQFVRYLGGQEEIHIIGEIERLNKKIEKNKKLQNIGEIKKLNKKLGEFKIKLGQIKKA